MVKVVYLPDYNSPVLVEPSGVFLSGPECTEYNFLLYDGPPSQFSLIIFTMPWDLCLNSYLKGEFCESYQSICLGVVSTGAKFI